MNLNPYLSFRDRTREAMEFYRSVFGGELEIDVFGSYPEMGHDPSENDLVMHAQLTTPNGLVLMASDTPSGMEHKEPQGFSISYSGGDTDAVRTVWEKLADGGTVTMPLDTPPWGGLFGMLTDRFGIDWMLAADVSEG